MMTQRHTIELTEAELVEVSNTLGHVWDQLSDQDARWGPLSEQLHNRMRLLNSTQQAILSRLDSLYED